MFDRIFFSSSLVKDSSSSSKRGTPPIKWQKGQPHLSIQKNGCSRPKQLHAGRPAHQCPTGLPSPASLGMSHWTLLDSSPAILKVVFRPSHTQAQSAADKRTPARFGARKPPGTCPVIYFWLFSVSDLFQPSEMTRRKVQTVNLTKHQKLFCLRKSEA